MLQTDLTNDSFDIVREIGSGASGRVFEISGHHSPQKRFALKVLKNDSQSARDAFLKEAEFLSRLQHPGLVSVKGFSVNGSQIQGAPDAPCFWMELIEGTTLSQAIAASPEDISKWLREALEALDYIHSQNILHGDIKPANIVIDSKNHLRLLDFGFAHLRRETTNAPGSLQGSLPYLPPEALSGEKIPASDLFALGIIFYEAIAGKHPRSGAKSLQELWNPQFESLEKTPSRLKPRVARVIDRLIEVDLAKRIKSARSALIAMDQEAVSKGASTPGPFHAYELIGREAERQRALDFIQNARSTGQNGLILVHGPSGIGRSRFLKELNFQLQFLGQSIQTFPDAERDILNHRTALFRLLKTDAQNGRILCLEYSDDRIDEETRPFLLAIAAEPSVCNLSLRRLEETETEKLLARVFGQQPHPLWTSCFHQQTLGNPSHLMHLAQILAESGLSIAKEPNRRDLEKLSNPPALEKIWNARLTQLSPLERQILEDAATASTSKTLEEISSLLEKAPSEIALTVAGLVAQGWLQSDLALGTFEMANESHRQLILDALPSVSLAKRLLTAANLIGGLGKERRTVALLTRALTASLDFPERENVLRRLANAYGNLEETQRQRETLDQWFAEFSKTLPAFDHFKYWVASGIASKNMGDIEEAKKRLREAVRIGIPQNPDYRSRLGRTHALLGVILLEENGDAQLARDEFKQARELAPPDSQAFAEVFRYEACLEARENDWPRAIELMDRSLSLCDALHWRHGRFSALMEKGNLALRFEDLPTAEESYRLAFETAEEARDEALLGRILHNLGLLDTQTGDYARALDRLMRARELFLYFGNPEDRAFNLYQIALVEASLASFDEARRLFQEAESLTRTHAAQRRAQEVAYLLTALETGQAPSSDKAPYRDAGSKETWNNERQWLQCLRNGDTESLRRLLEAIHDRLPDELKIRFEERPDYRRIHKMEDRMDLMKRLYEITRELLTSREVDDVLSRIMDAAMALAKAERGFLLIQTGPAGSQDFEVRVARNVSRDAIDGDEFRGSLTAVREAIREGKPMVTDNAMMDARFKTSESVQQLDLKSILVLPLKTPEGILGGLYLDHRYQTDLFHGTDLKLLEMFSDQAALALQKAQMIASLKQSNESLHRTVTEQSSEISALKKEVTEQREALTHEYGEIIGRAPAMVDVLQLVDRLVDTTIPVWIFGESGTGKEMIARALHMKGPRAKKPFITENCSSLPETLLESELFGHKKGSFTHADRDKKGLLQHADGGTVFLDEIADMSPAMQSKMLRFLQEGEIRPLGSNETIKVDVRVVSASNKDLNKLITEGKFREDLFYRLNGITVPLPSLRERVEDIPLLAEHFLDKIAKDTKKGPYEITPEALSMLTDYNWPGNVRELENTLRSACLFHYKHKLLPKSFHFKKALYGSPAGFASAMRGDDFSSAPAPIEPPKGAVKSEPGAELGLLLKALRDTNYHKSEAAKTLGISRRYLYKQLTKYAVPLQRIEMKEFVERTIGPKR